jgi:hypothetical protein
VAEVERGAIAGDLAVEGRVAVEDDEAEATFLAK